MYLTFEAEYQDENDKTHVEDCADLASARSYARRVSRKTGALVYVVATNASGERVGAECYAYGRRDHTEGRVAA